jgi:hypothetical protein
VAQPKGDERRRTERLYRIDPSFPPQRLDEIGHKRPRGPDDWAAAEQLLRGLNFQTEERDDGVTYKLRHEHFVVLADPRADGEIGFCVFDSDEVALLAERRSKKRVTILKFWVYDSWAHDVVATFKQRLSDACSRLVRPRPTAGPRILYPPQPPPSNTPIDRWSPGELANPKQPHPLTPQEHQRNNDPTMTKNKPKPKVKAGRNGSDGEAHAEAGDGFVTLAEIENNAENLGGTSSRPPVPTFWLHRAPRDIRLVR